MTKDPQPSTRLENVTRLDNRSTTMFLRMSLPGPRKPIDSLLERLREAPGSGLFAELLRCGPAARLIEGPQAELAKNVALEPLKRLKDDSVELFRTLRDLNSHLCATATFFAAIAAALARHGQKITSQPTDELEGIFLDLAASLANPWDELFIAAAQKLKSTSAR